MPRVRIAAAAGLAASVVIAGSVVSAAPALAGSPETYVPSPSGLLAFTGHGWGHGIGMSQWGAYGAASAGLSAAQILDFYYPGTTATPIDPNTPVRVLLGTDDGVDLTVDPVTAGGALTFTDAGTNSATSLPASVGGAPVTAWRAALVGGAIQLQGQWSGAYQGYPVGAPVTVNTGHARFTTASGVVRLINPSGTRDDLYGSLDAVIIGGALRSVETAPLDQMLVGVVGSETPANWPTAALQAQAVAARSYIDYQVRAHTAQQYDISIPRDVAYEGIARYDSSGNRITGWDDPRLVAAVKAFPGDVRTYNGQPIFAMFSSSNGGYTVAGTVGGAPAPYLIAKPDPYDAVAANPHNTWTANVNASKVQSAYPSIGTLTSIVVNARDGNGEWGGRTTSVTVVGTSSSATDSGGGFAAKLGLQSSWWSLPGQGDPVGAFETLQAAPGGAHLSGWAYDPKTTGPILVHLYVDGSLATAVPANVDRPDLAGVLPNGTAHGFAANIPLAAGTHSVCAYAISSVAGTPNPKLGCLTVQTYAGSPVGAVHIQAAIGGVQLLGWAVDPESVGPVSAPVTVDGHLVGTLTANSPDSTAAASFPFYGPNHGFSNLLVISGTHNVCVSATNIGAGSTVTLGCAQVTVYAGAPLGNLDAVVPSPGKIALWGWSFDPDTLTQIPVHLYIDGQLVAALAATEARPDVQAVFPAYGGAHGYSALVPLSAGQHTVCTYGINSAGGGGNTKLGCKTVTVPNGDPVGHLDGVAYSNQVVVWGWAADPKVPTAPVLVHIYVDGVLTTLGPATLPRPDVANVFPAFGAAHGFFVGFTAGKGTHRVCAFAINSLAGGNNPQLGCGTVTVP